MSSKIKYKRLNLIETYNRVPKSIEVKKPAVGRTLFMIFLILSLAGTSYYYYYMSQKEAAATPLLEDFINSYDNLQIIDEYENNIEKIAVLNAKEKELLYNKNIIDSSDKINQDVFRNISSCLTENARVRQLQYLTTGQLILTVSTPDVNDCYRIADRIDSNSKFLLFGYSGYSYSDSELTYSMSIDFTLTDSKKGQIVDE